MKIRNKNLIYPLVIGILLILTNSCKKDDDNGPDLKDTTWNVFFDFSSTLQLHANVTFNADGTTKYEDSHGVWSTNKDKIHWTLGMATSYTFDGTVTGNTMSGTFLYGGETRAWSATKNE